MNVSQKEDQLDNQQEVSDNLMAYSTIVKKGVVTYSAMSINQRLSVRDFANSRHEGLAVLDDSNAVKRFRTAVMC
jgi:hypothetical protein